MGILKYSRKSPLEGVGTTIVEDKDLNQIMEEAGLKYTVEKVQNFDPEGDPVDSWCWLCCVFIACWFLLGRIWVFCRF